MRIMAKDSVYHDNNGNIRTIQDEVGVTTIIGDALQRLIREDNVRLDKTIIYTRDAGSNVTQKRFMPLVHRQIWKASLNRQWYMLTQTDGKTR